VMLEIENATKNFGSVIAVNDVSLKVERGDLIGVMGPNGAGKTTLLSLIDGTNPLSSGRISFFNQNITGHGAAFCARSGIGRTFQIPKPFEHMSVYENVLVSAIYAGGQSTGQAHDTALQVLDFTKLSDRGNQISGGLTLLQRKRLELARALSGRPKLLLLDEIAAGLTDLELAELLDVVRQISGNGMTIIWIEHVVHALTSLANRLIVIDFGSKIADGPTEEVINSDAVKQVYLGVD